MKIVHFIQTGLLLIAETFIHPRNYTRSKNNDCSQLSNDVKKISINNYGHKRKHYH